MPLYIENGCNIQSVLLGVDLLGVDPINIHTSKPIVYIKFVLGVDLLRVDPINIPISKISKINRWVCFHHTIQHDIRFSVILVTHLILTWHRLLCMIV